MPPKRRISKSTTPHLGLYQHLISPTLHPDALLKSMERQLQDEPILFVQSVNVMTMKLAGLGEQIASIDLSDTNRSVKEIIDEMYERYDAGGMDKLTTMLTQTKNIGYNDFVSRLNWMLETLLSTDFKFASHIIKPTIQLICILSSSKLRQIRLNAVIFTSFFISALSSMFYAFINLKLSKQAYTLIPAVQTLINDVLKERIMDIDQNIKDEAVKGLKIAFIKLQDNIATQELLKSILLKPISEGSNLRLETSLGLVLFLLKIKKIEKVIVSFCELIGRTLEEIALSSSTSQCAILALQILIELENLSKSNNSHFSPAFFTSLFHAHSSPPTPSLHLLVSIFYLTHHCTPENLPANRSALVLQIMYLLRENDSKSINAVLDEFMEYGPIDSTEIFKIQDLFVLIMAEFYHLEGSDVYLRKQEIQILMRMIDRLTTHIKYNLNRLKNRSQNDQLTQKQKQIQQKYVSLGNTYNLHLFTSLKQILFTKISNSSSSSIPLYFNLLSKAFFPVQPEFNVYLDYVLDKLKPMFQGQDNGFIAESMVKTWIAFGGSPKQLIQGIRIENKQELQQEDIAKISALISYAPFPNSASLLGLIINSYKKLNYQSKLNAFLCLKHLHRWAFKDLMNHPSHQLANAYFQIRNQILQFGLNLMRGQDEEVIKLASFGLVCSLLQIACNNQISQMKHLVYEPQVDHMISIFKFIQLSLPSSDSLSISFSALSVSLPSFHQQILSIIFHLFSKSYKIAFNEYAVEFIGWILKKQIGGAQSLDSTLNQSLNETKVMAIGNIFMKEKYVSKFFEGLVAIQMKSQSKFTFWKFVSSLLNQRGYLIEPVVNYIVALYYRRRSKISYMSKKLLLFLVEQFAIGIEKSELTRLKAIEMILKKAKRRIDKEAIYKFAMFCKEKAVGGGQEVDKIVANINKMAKEPIKANKSKEQEEQNDKDNENEEDLLEKEDENDQRMDRKTVQKHERRSTRRNK